MSSGKWSGEDEIECAICGELLESEDALQEHSREEHPDRNAH